MTNVPMIRETIATSARTQVIDITQHIQRALAQHKVRSGMAVVFVPHTTAAITINENADPDVKHDLLAKLEQMIPVRESYYDHAEGNSDAHVKTVALGSSVTLLIEANKLMLGRWQGVYFCEFDGPRERQIWIKLVDFGEVSGQ